ncbi:MAG: CHAT domain-containing protein [Hydrococcus sp. Prado102]|jgi:CHAT domain-containing protein|nr:CHAT domain-containing protein [Hydrococcus sp. Prado102]
MNKISIFISVFLGFYFGLTSLKNWNVQAASFLKINEVKEEAQNNSENLEQQAQQLYENGQLTEAIKVLERAIALYPSHNNSIERLFALRNLALIYTQLGNFEKANSIISDAIDRSKKIQNNQQYQKLLAQSLDVKGKIQLSTGQAEQALETWQNATQIYRKLDDTTGATQAQINQVQALQTLGLYDRAAKTIVGIDKNLASEPDTLLKAKALQSLGNVLLQVGEIELAESAFKKSLAIAQKFQSRETLADISMSLGNTARLKKYDSTALAWYQNVIEKAPSPSLKLQAQVNSLSLLIQQKNWSKAENFILQIEQNFKQIPPSRTTIYSKINFALSLMKMRDKTYYNSSSLIGDRLATAIQEAKKLGDKRAESYGLGTLGNLYEQSQRWEEAKTLTEKALSIAQAMNADDLAYQWQWQLGRLLKVQKKNEEAIVAYRQSVNTLQTIRRDLLAANPEIQFEFRESVEPVYRQLVDLLLQPSSNQDKEASQENLVQAREAIESLQLAELENFFREICLVAKQPIDRVVDNSSPATAIVYPIILPNRIEIILKLPQQPLRRYTTYIPQKDVENTLTKLRRDLTLPYTLTDVKSLSNQTYNWLLQPLEKDLQQNQIKTLVFVLDGSLRNIPMAVLYDGKQYLVQKYSIAIAPGLQLVDPKPLQRENFRAIAGGLSEARLGFPPLQFVKNEVAEVQNLTAGVAILDRDFTESNLNNELTEVPFPIVHLATHGNFSSKAEDTYIVAWDKQIPVKDFDRLLRSREPGKNKTALELLVLSACQTATGDKQAALGLAGIAVRSGARSVLASLWDIADESTAMLMSQFYRELANKNITKAEALRNAQLNLLQNPQYEHPSYWAPYVLVGNWL